MAVQPITSNKTAIVDSNGILAQFVQYPCDNSPEMTGLEARYYEKFKGPYSAAKEVANETGITLSAFHTKLTTATSGNAILNYYSPPTPPTIEGTATYWKVEGIRVEEIEAGDHAFVYVTYVATKDFSASGSITSEKDDIWNCSWQSYTVSPWAFCAELTSKVGIWSPGYDANESLVPTADWTATADSVQIQNFMNAPQSGVKKNFLHWTPDLNQPDTMYFLQPANWAIWRKAKLQRSAVYHTPVVTHQTKTTTSGNFGTTIGSDLDTITSLPNECPFTFPSDTWEWIKTADSVSMEKQKSGGTYNKIYTRSEQWNGYPKGTIDKNYYGTGAFAHTESGILSGRWEINSI